MAEFRRPTICVLAMGVSLLALTACTDGFDFDLRDAGGGFDTTEAVRQQTLDRPRPDDKGIVSYPNFQVAIANRGDTVVDVANRVGVDPAELARYNGLPIKVRLRRGEVVALPARVAEPSPETGAKTVEQIDITSLSGNALDRADSQPPANPPFQSKPAPKPTTGREPIQHKVERGETAYSISRLYGVSVRVLADWNGLGPNLTLRDGQFLLIPVVRTASPETEPETAPPGAGSLAPEPPSASKPLPDNETAAAAPPPSPNLAKERTTASGNAKFLLPVSGKIIRRYERGKNDGIDVAAQAGSPVLAAANGTVAAITRDTDQVPILVLRHDDNFLTVYANIDKIKFAKGTKVSRGQAIAEVRDSNPGFLHFEVREGFESVDPVPYVN